MCPINWLQAELRPLCFLQPSGSKILSWMQVKSPFSILTHSYVLPHMSLSLDTFVTVCQRSLVFNFSMGFYFYFMMMCQNWAWPRWGFILPHLRVTNKQQETEHETPSIKSRLRFWGTGRAVKEIMEANPTVSTSTGWAVSNKRKWKCLFLKVSQTTRKSQRLT